MDNPEGQRPMFDDAVIKQMVDRFLCWRLPANFVPDNGISFKQVIYAGMSPENQAHHWPVGTNLLDAAQAEAMVRHMLEGLAPADREALRALLVRRRSPPLARSKMRETGSR